MTWRETIAQLDEKIADLQYIVQPKFIAIDAIIAGLPVPRFATIGDITNVIDFFAADNSSYITAQTLYLGGVN